MRPETEPRPRRARPLPELDAEQEIDLARQGRTLLARWWLVLLAIAVGALLGWVLSAAAGSDTNRAEATVYLGQPVAALGGALAPNVSANSAAVREVARSEEVVEEVAAQVDVPAAKLRSGISTAAVGATSTRQGQTTQVYELSVRGPWPKRTVAEATNLLATAVVQRTSGYVDAKIEAYQELLAGQERELAAVDRRIEALEAAVRAPDLSDVERLTITSLIGFSETRRGQLLEERVDTRLLLAQARDVEKGRVVTEARASQVTPRSSRSSIVVGGLLGLVAGVVLALAWEPLARRRRPRLA